MDSGLSGLNSKKRVTIRLGDIFVVKLEDCQKYFQYIADDMTMLNSSVIRAFREKYLLESVSDLKDVVNGEVEFYAHTSLRLGVKMGLWEKVGNNPDTGTIAHILFRDSKDYGHGPGEKPVKISSRWEVWRINEEFRYVGKLQGENRKAEIGVVEPPIEIIERMKTGKYSYSYPGFE
jgi:hypothetical protein